MGLPAESELPIKPRVVVCRTRPQAWDSRDPWVYQEMDILAHLSWKGGWTWMGHGAPSLKPGNCSLQPEAWRRLCWAWQGQGSILSWQGTFRQQDSGQVVQDRLRSN